MRNFRFTILLILVSFGARAGEIKYPVGQIPEALLKNANVVKRLEENRYEIVKLDEVIYTRKVAFTILNENGRGYAAIAAGYDKLRKITGIEGSLYDAAGNLLKKTRSRDIQDMSDVEDNNLFDDNRMKAFDFNYNVYPYTVEYEVEIKINNSYSMPSWMPQSGEKLAVERSSYSLIVPSGYQVRYKAFNYKGEPVKTTQKNQEVYTWSVQNLPAIIRPYASPVWNEMTTTVFFSPSVFEMEGYKGEAVSWQELGKFPLQLNAGRDKLPDNILQKVTELTQGITDEKEKIRKLYAFLQQNTRYISIQLGIGGLQPFEASFVAEKGYGDCKALSNYMYSLLKAAGIGSYYTLVHAGRDMDDKYLSEDFPSDRFNHIILCVPLVSDTMWLECTSQTESPGYMSGFTGNRKALLITEDGGKLVSTPRYGLKENWQQRKITARVLEDGSLNMKVATEYRGGQQDELSMMINYLSKDKVKKYLQEELELATYDINDFGYHQKKDVLPELQENLDVTVSNYATITGRRLFITPNILSRGGMQLEEDERKVDYVLDYEFHNDDQEEIEIPEGYTPEAIPQDVILKTRYGTYSCTTKIEGNKIMYHRIREQYSGRFPAKEQAEFEKFYEAIYKADRAKIVLVKKG